MPGETHGQIIELVWPDGNDDGELFIRGHVPEADARETILRYSTELESLALDTIDDSPPVDADTVERVCRGLINGARVEHGYARWSREDRWDLSGLECVLRYHREPGPGGRFPVTAVTLWPRPPCHLSVHPETGTYLCCTCGRRFIGPTEPHVFGKLADCPRLVGDECAQDVPVYEELESRNPPMTDREPREEDYYHGA